MYEDWTFRGLPKRFSMALNLNSRPPSKVLSSGITLTDVVGQLAVSRCVVPGVGGKMCKSQS